MITTEIGKINTNSGATKAQAPEVGGGLSFKEALGKVAQPLAGEKIVSAPALKFSSHAIERMQQRGIKYSPEQLSRIENAISRAAQKGSKEALLLADESAMIVSVSNRTVVTVMDKQALKENVFTNIDSTVFI